MTNFILFIVIGFIFYVTAQIISANISFKTQKTIYSLMIGYLLFMLVMMWLGGILIW